MKPMYRLAMYFSTACSAAWLVLYFVYENPMVFAASAGFIILAALWGIAASDQ